MAVSVAVSAAAGPVAPGGTEVVEARIRNTGAVVDHFVLDIVGDAAGWALVEPASVNLLPGEEATARIFFSPPRSPAVREGWVAYALRVMSREDAAGSAVEESAVEVAPFSELAGELTPRTSTGKMTGRHELVMDNLGNHPQLIAVTAGDADARLKFTIEPSNLTLEPGTATFIKLRVKPRQTFWRAPNKTHPFVVVATPSDGDAISLPGSMLQTSLLPAWFFKAVALAVVACLALAVLWFTLLRPVVQSTARAVAEDSTEKLAEAIESASEDAEQANEAAEEANSSAATAQKKAATAGKKSKKTQSTVNKLASNGGSATTLNPTRATDFRITTDVPAAGGFSDEQYEVADGDTVWISDLVLQNPAGNTGTLRIQRGDDILLVLGLDNFRDLDYHFIQPAMFNSEAPVVVSVDCKNETERCTPSVYFSGQVDKKQPAKKKAKRP